MLRAATAHFLSRVAFSPGAAPSPVTHATSRLPRIPRTGTSLSGAVNTRSGNRHPGNTPTGSWTSWFGHSIRTFDAELPHQPFSGTDLWGRRHGLVFQPDEIFPQ